MRVRHGEVRGAPAVLLEVRLGVDEGLLVAAELGERLRRVRDDPRDTLAQLGDAVRRDALAQRRARRLVDELDPPRLRSERETSVSWRILWEAPFLDAARSPALSRAFFVPGWSSKRNVYGTYRVYGKESSL